MREHLTKKRMREIVKETEEYYQKNPFGFKDDTCQYINGKRRCAVGRLLDKATALKMEQDMIGDISDIQLVYLDSCGRKEQIFGENILNQLGCRNLSFFLDLQSAHDQAAEDPVSLETRTKKEQLTCLHENLRGVLENIDNNKYVCGGK